ncbi:ubiquitin-like domain-containing protein [Metabacillus halosaccharovorans]|uniref:ubiquitin-like domain-containing protein n=1 Tax=Metabacillus halosaccharovorans TaxID=930124 RepID=UPI00298F780B|nr:ubiquitin-like domain-containing protein [Metabacillus halosaccharovorans]
MKKLFSEKVIKNKFVLSATSLIVLGSGSAYGTYELTKESVSLTINGKEEIVRTHANTVNDLLKEYEIDIRQEDELSHDTKNKIKDDMKITYKAAKPIKVAMGDERRTIWTTADTVKELIQQEDIDVTEHDRIEPALDTVIKNDLSLTIDKAFQITLNVGEEEKQHVWTTSTTVADFLKNQDVQLNELDKVKPALTDELTEKSNVTVTRIEKVTDVVEEPIAFNVVEKKDDNIEKGVQKVINSGKEGKQEKHYEVTIENGQEVTRKLLKTETVQKSEDRVVALGTKVVQTSTTIASRGNDSVSKEFYVNSTAYTANCNGCSGTTATGVNLKANPNAKVIAVDPSVIPLGTKVYVEGYGYAVAADTGSAIKGNKIDVFLSSKSAAYRWGSKRVKIKILE